jgi:hypothetical protein
MKIYAYCEIHDCIMIANISTNESIIKRFNCAKADYRPCEMGIGNPPICASCGNRMKEAIDSIQKKKTGYNWKCRCVPKIVMSIG